MHYQGFPTSNHYGATADGLVLAYRVGAPLREQYTLQYHPTGAAFPEQIFGALVTEKVRSLGAKLVNVKGEVFMNPDELADYMEKQNESHDKLEQGGIDYEAEMVYVRFTEDPPSDAVGQLADTILVLDTAENAICVSNNLIKTVDGEKVVYVLKDGEKTAVPVEIGLQTGSQSEITSGINEGDELVIR